MGRRSRKAKAEALATGTPAAAPAHPTGPLPEAFAPSLVAAWAVVILAGAVYFKTLAPTCTLIDSGELILAAYSFGVAHPPGTPLYVLLAHLASLVPLGSVAVRVNAASALFAALAAGVVALVVRELLLGLKRADAPSGEVEAPAWVRLVPLAVAGLSLAFGRSLWAYATVAEVYSLNTLLVGGIWLLMLRWRRTSQDKTLLAAAALFGLALGVHHVTIGLMLPALAVLVYGVAGFGFFGSRRIVLAALASVAALVLVYSVLPFAASRHPVFPWGNPVTLERLLWHVSGRQYQAFFEVSKDSFTREGDALLRMTLRQFGPSWLPVVLVLAAAGLVWLWRRERTLAASLLVLCACNVGFGLTYVIGEDKDAYYLPVFLALAVAAGCGAQACLAWATARGRAPLTAALLAVPLVVVVGNYAYADRSRYVIAQDYVSNVLASVAPDGMLLTADWQLYSPLLYVREVEGRRRDVVAMDIHLLRRSWYFDYLKRQYPGTMAAAGPEVEVFLEDLDAWEHDPARYAASRELTERISRRFTAMIRTFVAKHPGRVYATRDVALPPMSPDPEVSKALLADRDVVPQGLVFELTRERGFHEPEPVRLETRGLFDGSIPFEPDDVVSLKVKPTYLYMVAGRGLYLAAGGDHRGAIVAYDEALALDPGYEPARAARERSQQALSGLARP
jgi:hypothetical protein